MPTVPRVASKGCSPVHGGDLMKRLVLTLAGIGTFVVFAAGPALAFQCPKLVGQINAEAGRRFDNASYNAKMKAAEATKLHSEGKHADSEKVAKEALASLGVK
jgi:uncharacterized protein YbjT (DUF2867 family)